MVLKLIFREKVTTHSSEQKEKKKNVFQEMWRIINFTDSAQKA